MGIQTSAIYLTQFLGVSWGSIFKPSCLHSQHLPLGAVSITPGWSMIDPLIMIKVDEVRCLGGCTWSRRWNLDPFYPSFCFPALVGILLLSNFDVLCYHRLQAAVQASMGWDLPLYKLFLSCVVPSDKEWLARSFILRTTLLDFCLGWLQLSSVATVQMSWEQVCRTWRTGWEGKLLDREMASSGKCLLPSMRTWVCPCRRHVYKNWAWWCILVIPVPGSWRQEELRALLASQPNTTSERSCLQTQGQWM